MLKWKKIYYIIVCGKYRKFKSPKISFILQKTLVLSIVCSKCGRKYRNIIKEEQSIEMLKIVGLIKNIELYQDYDWRKDKPRI